MKRLRRSDSSMMAREHLGFFSVAQRRREVAQRAGRRQHGRQRGLEIVRDRREQGGAQPIRFDRALGTVDVLD
jgi:hypothetical protein